MSLEPHAPRMERWERWILADGTIVWRARDVEILASWDHVQEV